MDKLIETLGKILQSLLSSKTLWIIIVGVAIFSLAILAISETDLASFFGLEKVFSRAADGSSPCARTWVGLAALVSLALILARVAIWLIKLLRDQYFA